VKDSELMSVPQCAKLVGKHPPQLYKYIKEEGMPSHNGKVVLGEVKAFLETREPRARGVTQESIVTEKIEQHIQPFVKNPVLSLWDRGNDKGWAVAAITDVPEVEYDVDEASGQRQQHLITFKVDYREQEAIWPSDRVVEEVAEGKIVLAEPQAVLRLIAAQLKLFDPADRPERIIENLLLTAERLDEWKVERTKA
jgi:hypothetical protein